MAEPLLVRITHPLARKTEDCPVERYPQRFLWVKEGSRVRKYNRTWRYAAGSPVKGQGSYLFSPWISRDDLAEFEAEVAKREAGNG